MLMAKYCPFVNSTFTTKTELRTKISIERPVSKILNSQGFLAMITRNEVVFLNILGGNSLLLKCSLIDEIVEGAFDLGHHFMYLVDSKGFVNIMYVKLTLSKANTNECNSLYLISNISLQTERVQRKG